MKQTKSRANVRQADAVEETLRLYHAWLAVLLMRMGEEEIRVGADDIKNALGSLRCRVAKEGETYVICMDKAQPLGDGDACGKEK